MIRANDFIQHWKNFFQESSNDWLSLWDNNSDWTASVIGKKTSGNSDSPFGEYLKKHQNKLEYRTEDGLFDLAVSTKENFKGVRGLDRESGEIESMAQTDPRIFYPTQYDILIEHENDPLTCYQEMVKLTYVRARLKVLVTYNWDPKGDEDYHYVFDRLADYFRTIIDQANRQYPEERSTQYVLIMGQRKDDTIHWVSYVLPAYKKTLYIDMDNVVVDFVSGINKLSEADKQQFQHDLDDHPEIFSMMDPMPGALEAIDDLSHYFDIYLLSTSPWNNPNAWKHKLEWVQKYLGDIMYKRLILSHNKHLNKGEYLIDDRPHNGAASFEGTHIQFDQGNPDEWQRVGFTERKRTHRRDDMSINITWCSLGIKLTSEYAN